MLAKEYILLSGITGAMGSIAMKYFHKAGYGIIGVGRSKIDTTDAINQYCEVYYQLPVFNDEHCKKLSEFLIDKKYFIKAAILLNGGFFMDQVKDIHIENFQKLLEQNFTSSLFLTKYLLPIFESQQNGILVYMSARSTLKAEDFVYSFSYTASKSLINHLANTISASYKNIIRVGLIKPKIIDTLINRKAMPNEDHSKWVKPIVICQAIDSFIKDDEKLFSELIF